MTHHYQEYGGLEVPKVEEELKVEVEVGDVWETAYSRRGVSEIKTDVPCFGDSFTTVHFARQQLKLWTEGKVWTDADAGVVALEDFIHWIKTNRATLVSSNRKPKQKLLEHDTVLKTKLAEAEERCRILKSQVQDIEQRANHWFEVSNQREREITQAINDHVQTETRLNRLQADLNCKDRKIEQQKKWRDEWRTRYFEAEERLKDRNWKTIFICVLAGCLFGSTGSTLLMILF